MHTEVCSVSIELHVSVLKITVHFSLQACVNQDWQGYFAHYITNKTQAAAASHHVRGWEEPRGDVRFSGLAELVTSITAIMG